MRLEEKLYQESRSDVDTIVDSLLADIKGLGSGIAMRAADIESARRIPPDLVETLRSIGIFRMFVPRNHGGLELDLPAALKIITALSRIEASIGWIAMIGSGGSIVAPSLPRPIYEQVYRAGPDVIIAGSMQPAGTAEWKAGAWRVNGRWPFASGCQHADWIIAFCRMHKNGQPMSGEGGRPLVRGFLLPARDWQIEDTWYAAGLKGTGSHHIAVRDKVVPEANFIDFENGTSCEPGPLYQAVLQFLPLMHGAFSVGAAEGALDDLLQLANTGRQQSQALSPMRDSEVFQFEIGRIEAELWAAQTSLQVRVASHWRHALIGTLKDENLFVRGTQTAIWVATACVRVADACFLLGGGSALYESSPLQRRMRDLHAAAQHAMVQQRHYLAAGKAAIARPLTRRQENRDVLGEHTMSPKDPY
jgi:alkylation response protein AidB-like acyl-CoA dehydrogenase